MKITDYYASQRKLNKELTYSQKVPIVRRIAFVLPPNDKVKSEVSLRYTLIAGLDELNNSLNKKLNELSKIGKTVKKVVIDNTSPSMMRADHQIKNIENVIESIDPKFDIRVIVNLYNSLEFLGSELLINCEITHLYEISTKTTYNILNKPNSEICRLNATKPSQIFQYIEDIMIDIAMYYTYIEQFVGIQTFPVKKDFNRLKMDWLRQNLTAEFEKHKSENLPFISLSYFFHSKNSFDYHHYVEAWSNISNTYISENKITKHEITIEEQLKNHKSYKNLPIRKIKKLHDQLPSGEYLLIRTEIKPQQSKMRRSIFSLIRQNIFRTLNQTPQESNPSHRVRKKGIKRKANFWRNGLINILPESVLDSLNYYKPFITIYKIRKP
ncbi:MAG: hypothetical protein J0L56_14900 [Chitinophagales bacterium]|nr:hypothetical protein [Chitinophagales bacterium]